MSFGLFSWTGRFPNVIRGVGRGRGCDTKGMSRFHVDIFEHPGRSREPISILIDMVRYRIGALFVVLVGASIVRTRVWFLLLMSRLYKPLARKPGLNGLPRAATWLVGTFCLKQYSSQPGCRRPICDEQNFSGKTKHVLPDCSRPRQSFAISVRQFGL